uniref:Uncharacterized protein n=1 Tax=Rhizophagus irregularis (strain DAOM 181602 / DAOM 197198 / MUCL 43194) TaxID=747089 RepID=U9UNB6_RHIID
MNNELGDNNNIESDEGKNIKFDPINELDDDEKISTSFTINESDDEKKSSVNNEENEDFIFEKQIIPLSANQVNDESGTSEIRHVKSNGSVPEDDQKFTISYHSAKMKYESGLEYNKKIAIKYEEMIKISKKLKPSIQGNEKQSDIKYEEVIKSNASGAYPTRLIQDKNNIVEYEGVVKNNNKKLVDNNDVIKENEESEKNLRETHQSIFVGSDFKVISKRLDELRPDSADSVKLDDDKKISVNNTTINGSNNEKILLVNNQKNDESIIEEHITPLSTNQVNNDESGALEIQYVKSNEFFSENKNLDAPINTAFLEKNNFHIKGDINSDQMKYKSGSRYNKKIVTKYEEMTKNNKKLTQTCIIPDRILHGSCERLHKINNSGLYCNFLENQEIERSKLIHKKGNNALSCKPFDEVSLSTRIEYLLPFHEFLITSLCLLNQTILLSDTNFDVSNKFELLIISFLKHQHVIIERYCVASFELIIFVRSYLHKKPDYQIWKYR